MKELLRYLWNGTRYGSPEGPAIVIDWDKRTVGIRGMSPGLAVRVAGWVRNGQRIAEREDGKA